MRADWQVLRWLANNIHLRVAEETKSCISNLTFKHFLVSLWYVPKQLFTSMSVKAMGIHLAALWLCNYVHHYLPPLQ